MPERCKSLSAYGTSRADIIFEEKMLTVICNLWLLITPSGWMYQALENSRQPVEVYGKAVM